MSRPRQAIRLLAYAVMSTLVSAALVAGVVTTAHAEPGQVPDSGTRPAPAGEVPLPDGSSARIPATPDGGQLPLADEIAAVEAEIAAVVQQLRELEPQLPDALATREEAEDAWRDAEARREAAEEALAALVEEAYRGAAGIIPQLNGTTLRDFAAHAPLPVESPLGGEAAGRKLLLAEAAAEVAEADYRRAFDAEQTLAGRISSYESELSALQDDLEQLRERSADLLAAQEAEEQRRAAEQPFPLQTTVAGLHAHERAQQAVEFALAQLGKPYQWGAQGPDRYDCSGLVWDAYRSVGQNVPRVSRDQYHGTRSRPVARHALLPGDLVFFSRSSTDWRQIHHVGMYVGDGRMVHAPNRNDVVKVSPIWWSSFFGATRVVDAVGTPTSTPSPTPSPGPTTPGPSPSVPSPSVPPSSPPPSSPPPSSPPPSDDPTGPTVPDVRGMSPEDAEAEIRKRGLKPERGDPVEESGCAPDTVTSQDPPPDERVEPGATVTYHLCALSEVPDVNTGDHTDARQELRDAGFQVEISYVIADQPVGEVVRTVPSGGEIVSTNEPVVIEVAVPPVTGMLKAEALEALDAPFVTVDMQETDPADNPDLADTVQDQELEPTEDGVTVLLLVYPPADEETSSTESVVARLSPLTAWTLLAYGPTDLVRLV